MKKLNLILLLALLCSNMLRADWSLSYKLSGGSWNYNMTPLADGSVYLQLDANSTYVMYALIDNVGYANDAEMTENSCLNYELFKYDDAAGYTNLRLSTTRAGIYKIYLSWFDEKQHISVVYPSATPVSEYINRAPYVGGPALTWETVGGNVEVTMSDATGATNAYFRNGGLEGGANGLKVYSGSQFKTIEGYDVYFNKTEVTKKIIYVKKNNVTLPNPCLIVFQNEAFSWSCNENGGAWTKPCPMVYTYGTYVKFFSAPTGVNVGTTGRVLFSCDEYDDIVPNTYEARIYKDNVLKHSQVVESNDVLNFVPMETGTYQVKVIAFSGGYSSAESVAFDWEVEAGHVYGKSAYCDWLWNTGTSYEAWPVHLTIMTESNGNVSVTLTPNGDQGVGVTEFRGSGMPIDRFKVAGVAASTYFSSSWTGNVVTLSLLNPSNKPAIGTKISYEGVVEYKTGTHTNAWPTLNINDFVYGTKCASSDAVKPVISSFTYVESTTTSVTLSIAATDVDDEGTEQALTYLVTGNNEFEPTAVIPDSQGKFTLTGLKQNRTYVFTMTVADPSDNRTSASTQARVSWDNTYNIALNKSADAGAIQQVGTSAAKAVDGNKNSDNFWTPWGKGAENAWWTIDLGEKYYLSQIKVYWHQPSTNYTIYGSASGETGTWYELASDVSATLDAVREFVVTLPARYIKLVATADEITLIEFEVYGSGWSAADTTNPVITAFEKASADVTSVTFNVVASDEDDEGTANPVTYKVSATPDIAERDVTLDNGQFTLTDLTPGVSYTFTLKVLDPSQNFATANVVSTTAFYPPTDIAISAMGRITCTAAANATSYEARIYDGETLLATQNVVNGDILNFIAHKSSYSVRLISLKDSYRSQESETYTWNTTAERVYGVTNYLVSNQKTSQNEGNNADVFFTWQTLKNGNVRIIMTNAQGEVDNDYHFRGIGMNPANFALNGSTSDFASTFQCTYITNSNSSYFNIQLKGDAPALGSIITYSGYHVIYSVPGATNAYPNIEFSYIYGTPVLPIEYTDPVIATFTSDSTDYSTVELTISASDTDDDAVAQPTLTYTLSGDNDFTTTEVVPNAQGKVTLEGLKKNTTYNFHLVVADPNGNTDEADTQVTMMYDQSVNLALNKPCEAGVHQQANVASRANDGDITNFWTCYGTGTSDQWWWKVDLQYVFNVNRVRILFNDHQGKYNLYISEDGSKWTNYVSEFTIDNDHKDYTINVAATTRYFKFVSDAANVGIVEFEVYGTGYYEGDEESPVITAATLVGDAGENTATVSVTATDNIGVYACRFVDATNSYNQLFDYSVGKNITVTGLVPSTTYNFTITAYDRAENASAGFAMAAFTTQANDNVPHEAAPAPTHGQLEVISIYSDKFTSAVKTPFSWKSWSAPTVQTTGNIGGDNYVHYVFDSHDEVGIGDNFRDATTNDEGINVSTKGKLHMDVWSLADGSINVTLNNATLASNLKVYAGVWTSFDIDLAAFATSYSADLNSLKWMKFTGCANKTIAVDNIYFYTEIMDITLDETEDNSTIISSFNGLTRNVTLNRTFLADGYWYTLCLPFSLTDEQLAAAYGADYDLRYLSSSYMKSSDEMYLNFVKATELEAGMPYMFKPTGSSNEEYAAQTFTGVVIDNKTPVQATSYATMTGFYAPMAIAETDYALGSDDYLYHTDGTASKALRCYFTLNPPTAAPLRARCVFNESQVITNLDEQSTINNQQSKMIIDGRLIIIRDGRYYNAQGQLVK